MTPMSLHQAALLERPPGVVGHRRECPGRALEGAEEPGVVDARRCRERLDEVGDVCGGDVLVQDAGAVRPSELDGRVGEGQAVAADLVDGDVEAARR